MRPADLEFWVLSILDRVQSNHPIEDARVELKSVWPEVKKAARRLAGHANAARGEPILWLIGIDEKSGTVIGAARKDLAQWYPSVQAEFDGLAPEVFDLNIPKDGKTVVALLFETDRAPFVVKNPAYGGSGEQVQLEVPWRENASVRSAKRSDLLRLLVPIQSNPIFEGLSGHISASIADVESKTLSWYLELKMYVTPQTQGMLVIPFHKCSVWIEDPQHGLRVMLDTISLSPPRRSRGRDFMHMMNPESASLTIDSTSSEILINGPGLLFLRCHGKAAYTEDIASNIFAKARFMTSELDQAIPIDEEFSTSSPIEKEKFRWKLMFEKTMDRDG